MNVGKDERATNWRWKWRLGLFGFLLIPFLGVAWIAYNILTGDQSYRDGMEYSGDLKVLDHEFRQYYHGRTEYSALSLDELHNQGILSDVSWETMKKYRHEFHPFSSRTSDNETVLVIHGYWWEPDKFTKRDLTAAENAPDTVQ